MTEAPFRDVDHALHWAALTLARLVLKTSSLGTWRGRETSNATLTPQEAHGMAVQVLNGLGVLSTLELCYLQGKYLPPQLEPGPRKARIVRAIGKRHAHGHGGAGRRKGQLNADRKEAVSYLARYVMGALGEDGKLQAYRLLVDRYFAGTDGERIFGNMLRLRRREAAARRNQTHRLLEFLDVQVESRLHYALMVAGYIPGAVQWSSDFQNAATTALAVSQEEW